MEEQLYISVKEAAEVLNKTERTVRNWIDKGNLQAIVTNAANRGGKSGQQYKVLVTSLPKQIQRRYRSTLPEKKEPIKQERKAFGDFTKEEREQISFWRRCLDEWQEYRNQGGKKTERDEEFIGDWNRKHPDHSLTPSTIRRKYKSWEEIGDEALVDKRGGWNKGITYIPEIAWSVFEQYYLDEARPTAKYCHKLVATWAELEQPEILPLPSYEAFLRKAKLIPWGVVRYFRYGEKDADDKALPYIRRIYESLESNEIWVADGHNFDVMIRRENGSIYRPVLTMYQDVRSRKMMGWHVSDTLSSDANLMALRKGIMKHGIPKEIYTDNGREYLVKDIAGRGIRAKKKKEEEQHKPPPIFDRLGIKMRNAKVKNGRAKIIERAFRQVKEELSRLVRTFTGGHILERPERLKDEIKNTDKVISESEFIEALNTFVEGWYNQQPQTGDGMNKKTPDVVFGENLVVKRTATQEDLNLMLMRSTGMLTVSRVGVTLTMYGQKLEYYHSDLVAKHQRKKVYVRYDPEDMGQVHIYDENDKFLLVAENRVALTYNASKEDIKNAASEIKKQKREIKDYKDAAVAIYKAPDALEVMLKKSKKNIENSQEPEAKVIQPVRSKDKIVNPRKKAVGEHEANPVSLSRMIENAKRFQGGNNNGE